MTYEEETTLCPSCNGSGEGRADGTRCMQCKGLGEILINQEDKEEWDKGDL